MVSGWSRRSHPQRDPDCWHGAEAATEAWTENRHVPPSALLSVPIAAHRYSTTGWGMYGSSSRVTSSGVSLIDNAATASSR